ncbi:unnamed protein product [Blepharisma stoltei]|uniref:EF-hand domain-containing protein n=1 Tax=Blepharisma stoltei TaxID=1481888 RepID=A0AAU9JCZ2_9CILI|nr:unnamed protein product [Blepharisma stoltei]
MSSIFMVSENQTDFSAESLFDQMDIENTGILYLENLKALLRLIEPSQVFFVKQVLSNYIFDYKNFEITRNDFVKLYNSYVEATQLQCTRQIRAPVRVKINLKELMTGQTSKNSKNVNEPFSQRVLRRINFDKNSSTGNSSLRHILDESEVVCKSISKMLDSESKYKKRPTQSWNEENFVRELKG